MAVWHAHGEQEIAAQLAATTDPKTQKELGRKVKNFNRWLWDQHKSSIVEEGTFHSSRSQDAESLRAKLLATGEREIAEASGLDRIWGIGSTSETANANRDRWGENLLGKALMNMRNRLTEVSS